MRSCGAILDLKRLLQSIYQLIGGCGKQCPNGSRALYKHVWSGLLFVCVVHTLSHLTECIRDSCGQHSYHCHQMVAM